MITAVKPLPEMPVLCADEAEPVLVFENDGNVDAPSVIVAVAKVATTVWSVEILLTTYGETGAWATLLSVTLAIR